MWCSGVMCRLSVLLFIDWYFLYGIFPHFYVDLFSICFLPPTSSFPNFFFLLTYPSPHPTIPWGVRFSEINNISCSLCSLTQEWYKVGDRITVILNNSNCRPYKLYFPRTMKMNLLDSKSRDNKRHLSSLILWWKLFKTTPLS